VRVDAIDVIYRWLAGILGSSGIARLHYLALRPVVDTLMPARLQQLVPDHLQVTQRKQRMQLRRVLGQPPDSAPSYIRTGA
jgi:hypothetical protein